MKTVAIIQARTASARLSDKVFRRILGRPMLWHVLDRVSAARLLDEIVIATSQSKQDDKIERFAQRNKIKLFRGSESDCLDRYYQAAKRFSADTVVRITGDCPLICPEVIDKVIAAYLKGGYDYVSNTLVYTYPDGCDVEVLSFQTLARAWRQCQDPVNREHLTPYIRNSGRFRLKNVASEQPVEPGEFKWSVDRIEDLSMVKKIYQHLYKENSYFSLKQILCFLDRHPEVKKLNSAAIVNEGYYTALLKLPRIPAKKLNLRNSLLLKKQAARLIPGCSQTFSKGPSQFVQGASPVFIERGMDSHLWDVDGNEYIDYAMALGPIILGYNYPVVTNAVKKILEKGTTFTLPHRLEVELSEILCKIIPCAEMVRFGKNGSDATSGAVRVARAYTGRDKIACCGYHGWQDWYIATTARNKGVPEDVRKLTLTFEYNKIETLERIFAENKKQVACVVMEPLGVVEPEDNFLQKVKDLTRHNGALLIFDEIITGFRLSPGGAQEYFKVVPDLACFGKAMGNGFPISAIVGKKKIMKLFEQVFYSFTFGGEITSLAAAIATINELKEKNVIAYLWEQGRKIRDGYNILAREYGLEKYTQCLGLAPKTVVVFRNKNGSDDLLLKSLFQQECLKRGILFTGTHHPCFRHTNEDIDYTLRVYSTALEVLKKAIANSKVAALVEGEPLKPIFRNA